MIDLTPFSNTIDNLKDSGNYRVFNDIVRERGEFPKSIWYGPYNIKNIVNWCSNDYLGMGQSKIVIDAMHTALDQTGSGSGGTRGPPTRRPRCPPNGLPTPLFHPIRVCGAGVASLEFSLV